jgi:hypothetical protein
MQEYTNLEALDLDTIRGQIEVLGHDDVHQFSSVQIRITGWRQCFSWSPSPVGLISRIQTLGDVRTMQINGIGTHSESPASSQEILPHRSQSLRFHLGHVDGWNTGQEWHCRKPRLTHSHRETARHKTDRRHLMRSDGGGISSNRLYYSGAEFLVFLPARVRGRHPQAGLLRFR